MTYEEYISAMRTLQHVKKHIKDERGTGNLVDAIARNRTLRTLADAEFSLIGEYAKQFQGETTQNA